MLGKILNSLMGLYLGSLMISTAGMEIFSSFIGVGFLVILFLDLRQKKKDKILEILKQPPIILALVFLTVSVVSALLSPVAVTPLHKMIGINRSILLLIAFLYLFPNLLRKPHRGWMVFFYICFLLVTLYSFYQCITGVDLMRESSPFLEKISGFYRSIGFFAIPLTFAYSYGMVFFILSPLAFSDFLRKNSRGYQCLFYTSVMSIPLAVLASGSRGAWVAMALAICLYVVMSNNKKVLVAFAVSLVGVCILIFSNPYLKGRVSSIVDFNHTSNAARFTIWQANYEVFKDYFWLGAGPNQNDHLLPGYYDRLNLTPPNMLPPTHHAHSDLVQTAAGQGLVGLLSYLFMSLSFMLVALKAWWRERENSFFKKIALGSFLAQVYFHLGGVTQCNYIDREVNHMLLVSWFIGLSIFMAQRKKERASGFMS